jgi:hypothetical protein
VLKSVATGVIVPVAFVMVLAEVGLNIAPLIASAGIVGVAPRLRRADAGQGLPVGAVHDPGDQYGVGDVVDLGEAGGTVEAVGLRVTRVRDATGVVWYVRNGEVLRVGNRSQGWSTAIVDVLVAYDQDIPRVQELVRTAADELAADEAWVEKVIEAPEMAGIESVAGDAVTLRVLIKCKPNDHFAVQRSCADGSRRSSTARASRCRSRSARAGTRRRGPPLQAVGNLPGDSTGSTVDGRLGPTATEGTPMPDRSAFVDFVATRSQALLRTAYLLTRDWSSAEDLLQTALAKAWFAWGRIEGDPEPYVRKILVTTYASWWRRRWNGELATGQSLDLPQLPTRDRTAEVDNRDALWQALGRLPSASGPSWCCASSRT